jgi:hypothetical protein
MRSYHAAGSLPLASEAFLAEAEAFLAEAEAFIAEALAEAESLAEAFLAEEGLVVPAANDTTGWRHTGHVVCGFTVVLANHRRMHAVWKACLHVVTRTFRFHAPVVFVTNESKQIEQHGDDDDESLCSSFLVSAVEPLAVDADDAAAAAAVAADTVIRACLAHIHFESAEALAEAEALEAEALAEAEALEAEALEEEGSEELRKRT